MSDINQMIAFRKSGRSLAEHHHAIQLREKLRKCIRKTRTTRSLDDLLNTMNSNAMDAVEKARHAEIEWGDCHYSWEKVKTVYSKSKSFDVQLGPILVPFSVEVDITVTKTDEDEYDPHLHWRVETPKEYHRGVADIREAKSIIMETAEAQRTWDVECKLAMELSNGFVEELIQSIGTDAYYQNADMISDILDKYRAHITEQIKNVMNAPISDEVLMSGSNSRSVTINSGSLMDGLVDKREEFVNECLEKIASDSFVQIIDLQDFTDISEGMMRANMMVEKMNFSNCTLRHMLDAPVDAWMMFQRWCEMHPDIGKRTVDGWFREFMSFDDMQMAKFEDWSEDSITYNIATTLIDTWAQMHPEAF